MYTTWRDSARCHDALGLALLGERACPFEVSVPVIPRLAVLEPVCQRCALDRRVDSANHHRAAHLYVHCTQEAPTQRRTLPPHNVCIMACYTRLYL
eukprot:2371677-Prymnesium_polylepis.1